MAPWEREIAEALRWAAGGGQVPPAVWEGIQQAIRRPPRRRFRRWIIAPAAVLGALALALHMASSPARMGWPAPPAAGGRTPAAAPRTVAAVPAPRGALVSAGGTAGGPGRLVAGALAAGRSLGHGFRAGGLAVVLI